MRLITFIILLWSSSSLYAQVDTVYSIPESWIKSSIREGTTQYLVFFQNKQNHKKTGVFVWSRTLSSKTVGATKCYEVEQQWYSSDSASHRYVYSLVNQQNFLPIYHKTIMQRGSEAFDFYEDRMKSSDTVKNIMRPDFELQGKRALNWELDLETFSLLDLKEGKRYAINFYHPGGRTAPKLYEYKVVGSDKVKLFDGKLVDCWKLRIDYNPTSYAIFYISKKGKEMIKMEEDFGMGVRYKVRLATNF